MNKERILKLREFLEADPDDTFSRFALALELLKDRDTDTARFHFEYIRDHNPDYVGVYYHLGKLYEELGEQKKALKTFSTGISIARDTDDLHTASELEQAFNELENDYH